VQAQAAELHSAAFLPSRPLLRRALEGACHFTLVEQLLSNKLSLPTRSCPGLGAFGARPNSSLFVRPADDMFSALAAKRVPV
jgi:hypothetical protein